MFMEGKKKKLLSQMREQMQTASNAREIERAARLRDETQLIETPNQRGDPETHAQAAVCQIDPKKAVAAVKQG